MNQHLLAIRRIGPPQSTFEARIDALCSEHGLSRSALGIKAGCSKQTVANWITKAAKGKLSRTEELHRFAEHYKRTAEWLLGETMLIELPPEALRQDTKAMADEAVEMLVDVDKLARGAAAALMVGIRLNPPSVLGFYKAARLAQARLATEGELDVPPAGGGTRKRSKRS